MVAIDAGTIIAATHKAIRGLARIVAATAKTCRSRMERHPTAPACPLSSRCVAASRHLRCPAAMVYLLFTGLGFATAGYAMAGWAILNLILRELIK
jgi:hypothetical protein